MPDPLAQDSSQVRLDWGPSGAAAVAADVVVVVDVLSFSTSVCVAVERGMQVHPFRGDHERAHRFADAHGAVLADSRGAPHRRGAAPAPSLSPAGLLACDPVPRLVLPSPNGSAIAEALRDRGAAVVAGCLRNATAVARFLEGELLAGRSVTVIAAGERWPGDDSLRPALEDQLGAGAILDRLAGLGQDRSLSPEARACALTFQALRPALAESVRACASGRELEARGFAADVEIATALDASQVVPVLVDGAFTSAGAVGPRGD